jgi:hypothetical protein
MSNDGGLSIWVGDLDDYIYINTDIDEIDRANEREAEELRLEAELDEIGDIPLFAGKSTSAHVLSRLGIPPSEWRWATHQAEQALRDFREWAEIERPFIRGLLSLGKTYSVNRYAAWERVSRASALTATLPFGFKALLDQYLLGIGLKLEPVQREQIRSTLRQADNTFGVTAYRRAGMIQALIHQIAQDASPSGPLMLDRERTRVILSLARLRFSVAEMDIGSFAEVQSLQGVYATARTIEKMGTDDPPLLTGKKIRNWRLRHLHSLIFLFPYSIREALARGLRHQAASSKIPERAIAVNELALAHCSILLMRRNPKRPSTAR